MRNLTVPINDADYVRLGVDSNTISFEELKEKISIENARDALLRCNEIAKENGFSNLTLDEINAEIGAMRNAKNRN